MKITYRGDCDELYGQEIEVPDHDCSEEAVFRSAECVERHGLDCGPFERWTEEWWECRICHAKADNPEDLCA